MNKILPVETVIMIDSVTFDKIVTEEFRLPYSSQRALGYASQGSIHYISIEDELVNEEEYREETFEQREEWECYIWEDWFDAEIDDPYGYKISDRSPSVGVVCAKLRERGWEIPDEFNMTVWW